MASLLEAFYILFETRGAKEAAAETEKLSTAGERAAEAMDKIGKDAAGLNAAASAAGDIALNLSKSAAPSQSILANARAIAAAEANLSAYLRGNEALRESTLKALGGQEGLQERINAETAALARELIKVDREIDKAADEAARLDRNIGKADDNAGRLAGTFRKFVGPALATFGGMQLARAALSNAETYTRFGNSLRVAGLEGENLKAVQDSLHKSAVRNGADLEALGSLYGRVSLAAAELGVSQGEILEVTDAVASAVRVAGGDMNAASGAMLQLSQALGAGTVRAEEMNSIIEGLPPLAIAAAGASDKYGGSVSKLKNAVNDGKLSSKEFFELIRKGSAELEAKAAKAPLTVAQSYKNLQTNITVAVGKINEAFGITEKISAAFTFVADNLDTALVGLAGALIAAAIIVTTVYTPAMSAAAIATLAALWPILLIVAAVAAVGAAFALAYDEIKAFLSGQPSLIGSLAEKYEWFDDLIKGIGATFKLIGRIAKDVWKAIGDLIERWGPTVVAVVKWVFDRMIKNFQAIYGVAAPILGMLFDLFTTVFKGLIWPLVKWVFESVVQHVQRMWDLAWPIIQVFGQAFAFIFNAIEKHWDATVGKITAGANRIVEGARKLFGLGGNANINLTSAGIGAAQGHMALAGSTPFNAMGAGGGNRTTTNNYSANVNAPIDARGLNPQQMSTALNATIGSSFASTFDDGVSH